LGHHMRVINRKAKPFAIGRKVIIVKDFKSGMIHLAIGEVGLIVGEHIENLPDMGLFNIRVIEIEFKAHKINIGVGIADTYMEQL